LRDAIEFDEDIECPFNCGRDVNGSHGNLAGEKGEPWLLALAKPAPLT